MEFSVVIEKMGAPKGDMEGIIKRKNRKCGTFSIPLDGKLEYSIPVKAAKVELEENFGSEEDISEFILGIIQEELRVKLLEYAKDNEYTMAIQEDGDIVFFKGRPTIDMIRKIQKKFPGMQVVYG
jgi:hypothetical protein